MMKKFRVKHLVLLVVVSAIGFFLFATYDRYHKNKFMESQFALSVSQLKERIEMRRNYGQLLDDRLKGHEEHLKKLEMDEESDTKAAIVNDVEENRAKTMDSIKEFDRQMEDLHARLDYFESCRKLYSSWSSLFFPVKIPADFSDPSVERLPKGP